MNCAFQHWTFEIDELGNLSGEEVVSQLRLIDWDKEMSEYAVESLMREEVCLPVLLLDVPKMCCFFICPDITPDRYAIYAWLKLRGSIFRIKLLQKYYARDIGTQFIRDLVMNIDNDHIDEVISSLECYQSKP